MPRIISKQDTADRAAVERIRRVWAVIGPTHPDDDAHDLITRYVGGGMGALLTNRAADLLEEWMDEAANAAHAIGHDLYLDAQVAADRGPIARPFGVAELKAAASGEHPATNA